MTSASSNCMVSRPTRLRMCGPTVISAIVSFPLSTSMTWKNRKRGEGTLHHVGETVRTVITFLEMGYFEITRDATLEDTANIYEIALSSLGSIVIEGTLTFLHIGLFSPMMEVEGMERWFLSSTYLEK